MITFVLLGSAVMVSVARFSCDDVSVARFSRDDVSVARFSCDGFGC